MQTKLMATFMIWGISWGCGPEVRRKDRATWSKQQELQEKLAASEALRKSLESETQTLRNALEEDKRRLEVASQEEERLKSSLASKDDELKTKSKDILSLSEGLEALRIRLSEKESEVSRLEKSVQERESDLNLFTAGTPIEGLTVDEIKAKLAQAESARDHAEAELNAARQDKGRIEAALGEQKTKTLQAFLENAAPDTLFAADASDLGKIYQLEGRQCAVVFDIDRHLEVVRGPARDRLPRIRGFAVLPMRVAFEKAIVCVEDGEIRVSREEGYLYRMISEANQYERVLLSSRSKGSCDGKPEEVIRANVFGENPYQFLNPFNGSIDGIETIDLPRLRGGSLRVNMGSSVIGATTCSGAVTRGDGNHPVTMACKALMGISPSPLTLKEGCFSENEEQGSVLIRFN